METKDHGGDWNQRDWLDEMLSDSTRYQVGRLISKALGGAPEYMPDPQAGSYNLTHIMKFVSGQHAVLRQVNLGTSMFPNEKTLNEGYGPGPEHAWTYEELPALDPNLDATELKKLYRLAANALLDLSRLEFEAIGSLELTEHVNSWRVTRRPLTRQMNDWVSTGTCKDDLVFTSTSKYLVTLAQLHMDDLARQPNDAFRDELDCTQKYVARLLFRKMMGQRVASPLDKGPFRLWCDDFRPTNILLSGDDMAGVIDWEFAYAAPAEFSCAPPWWLLLQRPEDWRAGWRDWNAKYDAALVTFLEAMTDPEDAAIASGRPTEQDRLSQKMRHGWKNGDFWVMYCLQTVDAFDFIFWNGIFPRQYVSWTDFEAAWESAWSLLNHEEKLEAQRFAAAKQRHC